MSKFISIVGTVGVPACYGGFETLVENLLDEHNSLDKAFEVYCSSKSYDKKLEQYRGAKLIYLPLQANGIQSIPYDILSLLHAVFLRRSKNILLLGVSGAICLPIIKLFSNARIVTNIDGLEWKREKWGKAAKWFLRFSEKVAVRYSDTVVADNQAIADHVASEYDTSSTVIAYGGDHALVKGAEQASGNYALALCRIEPENNVELILRAFSNTDKQLKFIGNWNSSEFGRSMKEQFDSIPNIDIIDPIYDVETLYSIRQGCDLYIHGHSAGGTNPSLVEMMHFSKPIYAFDCSYNRETTENSAAYFLNSSALTELVNDGVGTEMGVAMVEIANRRYTWEIVRQQYLDLFY